MITAKEMKEIEDAAEQKGISKLALMENAGKGIFKTLKEKFDLKGMKVLVVAYHGNNGGDGFVAARHLCNICEIDVLFIGDENKLKKEAELNYKKIEDNEKIQFLTAEDVDFDSYDTIIDAILGVGVSGSLKEDISNVVDNINNSKAFKVSVDIPTGLDPNTGEVIDKCIKADLIITFHDIKQGLEKFKDKVTVVDIGA